MEGGAVGWVSDGRMLQSIWMLQATGLLHVLRQHVHRYCTDTIHSSLQAAAVSKHGLC